MGHEVHLECWRNSLRERLVDSCSNSTEGSMIKFILWHCEEYDNDRATIKILSPTNGPPTQAQSFILNFYIISNSLFNIIINLFHPKKWMQSWASAITYPQGLFSARHRLATFHVTQSQEPSLSTQPPSFPKRADCLLINRQRVLLGG